MVRSFIGAADSAVRPQVSAADGFAGVVLLLSWAANGCNFLPDEIDVSPFWKGGGSLADASRASGGVFQISAEELTTLVKVVGLKAGVSCKGLSPASLPVYLSQLRKGFRANYSAARPAVPSSYSRQTQVLEVRGMDFTPDDLPLTPPWMRVFLQGA